MSAWKLSQRRNRHQEFGMRGTVEVAPATATDVPSFNPARPAAVFDPAQMFNSGTIGTFPGPGMTFALTFETPGIFKYFCGIRRDQGMEGTIIVRPRQARGL